MINCKTTMDCLHAWGCGLAAERGLTPEEKIALHEFKEEVAELGQILYKKMDPVKADKFIIKAVFGTIEAHLDSAKGYE